MEVIQVPALEDNYIYILADPQSKQAVVIDPGAGPPAVKALKEHGLTPVAILNTHHHWDHTGGNGYVLDRYPGLIVYAGKKDQGHIDRMTHGVDEGDALALLGAQAQVFALPGHTAGHVGYYFEHEDLLFCGDTLFVAGCGRVFDGTVDDLYHSLQRLLLLPDDTRIYCGHEYTEQNLRFALSVQASHDGVRNAYFKVQGMRAQGQATVPELLGQDKTINPFLRVHDPDLQKALALEGADPLEVFRELRWRKDQFKG